MRTFTIDDMEFDWDTSIEDVVNILELIIDSEEAEEIDTEDKERRMLLESVIMTVENRQKRFTEELMEDVREMLEPLI